MLSILSCGSATCGAVILNPGAAVNRAIDNFGLIKANTLKVSKGECGDGFGFGQHAVGFPEIPAIVHTQVWFFIRL